MKNVKVRLGGSVLWRILFLAAMFVAFAATGFGNTPTKESSMKYQKEKSDINKDVAQIQMERNHVKSLKSQLKTDCKAKRDMAVVVDKKELCKARADLMRSHAYLRADKRDLAQDHRL